MRSLLLLAAAAACTDAALQPALCPVAARPCGPGDIGDCRRGRQLCDPATGEWGACEGASWGQGWEVCDGRDNDCDGKTDEPDAPPGCCGPPELEVCDGLDNDCDGQIDEGVTWLCGGATWCIGDSPDEIPCNGQDDDCDGLADENDGPPLEVAIAVDVSGSNESDLPVQRPALEGAVTDIAAVSCARFVVVQFPGNGSAYTLLAGPEPVKPADGAAAVASIAPPGGAKEPSYDVITDLAPARNAAAVRVLVVIADEQGQSWTGATEASTAAAVRAAGATALIFTGYADNYDEIGTVRPLAADIRAEVVAFVLAHMP